MKKPLFFKFQVFIDTFCGDMVYYLMRQTAPETGYCALPLGGVSSKRRF